MTGIFKSQYALVGVFLLLMQGTALSQAAQCTTVADCAQKAMEAAYQAKVALELAVPKGAVMAFNLKECPNGWSDFEALAGRVPVGAGKGASLTERVVGQQGGEETHLLTVPEMPSHNHNNGPFQYMLTMDGNWTAHDQNGGPGEPNLKDPGGITPAGGDQPHNIMQPFHVLKFCERK